jgi:hypothetical protein
MRGSEPHVHEFVRGWSSLTTGVGVAGHKALREFPCRRRAPAAMRDLNDLPFSDQVSVGSIRAIAHMKPTSSRATAVMATVLRFPRATSAR